ncbi:exonuclease SbcCD, D subunit [Treponema vincentii F0403]|uniref:Nuclease SbcCD subunit D n=1 Tax=Treponema vincentii F0403 TaxID=1125702 RepID=S3LAP3_9SPIR|nr:exonuclease SbcCD subunit D [Treponema vincentii]EPF46566.1 exonuclease SbcCD, D subunit [Treponema vincentii F0403]
MKLLHTADLHLGKTLHETPLLGVQEKMLNDIHDILTRNGYTALIIAGDVYDRAIPSAEAVSLFSKFLARIREDCPDTAVFIIPGNHDSAQRLAFAREILQNQRIYIAQDTSRLADPVILTKGTEKLAVYLLPFLNFGAFSEETKETYRTAGDSQAEMAAVASHILKQAVPPGIPALLAAHLFTIGGQSSASERTFIGTAEYVNPDFFSFFDYVALGHLHRCQRITDRMYYSGSPLPYSFDESDDAKCVLSIDIDCTPKQPDINGAKAPVTIERIPIISERPLKRLEGSFANFFTEHLYDEWSGYYLEITLNDAEVIAHPMQLLRQKFPFLLSIRQKSFMNQEEQEEEQLTLRERTAEDPLTLAENFNRFESLINGEQNRMKQELFEQLCKEALLNPNAD